MEFKVRSIRAYKELFITEGGTQICSSMLGGQEIEELADSLRTAAYELDGDVVVSKSKYDKDVQILCDVIMDLYEKYHEDDTRLSDVAKAKAIVEGFK